VDVVVAVDVVVDESAASLTFTARTPTRHLAGLLFASRRTEPHVHVYDRDQVYALRAFTARPIALSQFPHTL
jgi:hypothetical protein